MKPSVFRTRVGYCLWLAERDARVERIGRYGIGLAFAVAVILAVTGCATSPAGPYLAGSANGSEAAFPAPHSLMGKAEAKTLAKLWTMGAPGRAFCEVEPTSSMVPTFDSHSVLLLEKVAPADLRPNDIARYESPEHGNVTHRVVVVGAHGFRPLGDNCVTPDGIIRFELLRYRVAGILYCQ